MTRAGGLALGVTGADCGMLLFADARAGVVGACHAGWKGALTGVIEATLAAMEGEGARRADTRIALGPMIGGVSYEVGAEFVERFEAQDIAHKRFFTPSPRAGHALFDLPAFIGARIERLDVASSRRSASTLMPTRRAASASAAARIAARRITAGSFPRSCSPDFSSQ